MGRNALAVIGGKGAVLAGLEPTTRCLEGSCSVQMSYRTIKTMDIIPYSMNTVTENLPGRAAVCRGCGEGEA